MCDVWNLFKVNSKGTRTTSYLYLLLTLNILHTFFWLYCWHWACVFAGFENVYFRAILTKSVVLRDVVYKNLTSVLQYILRPWRWFKTRNSFFSLKRNILFTLTATLSLEFLNFLQERLFTTPIRRFFCFLNKGWNHYFYLKGPKHPYIYYKKLREIHKKTSAMALFS